MKKLLPAIFLSLFSATAFAQGPVDQTNWAPLFNSQEGNGVSTTKAEPIRWRVYSYNDNIPGNGKNALGELVATLDTIQGEQRGYRMAIVELANRVRSMNMQPGMLLAIPNFYSYDYLDYTPYPKHYTAADTFPKMLIIDKYTQTFGAYEHGNLVRWGLVSTGASDDQTPSGRYNFNWKAEYRESSEAPEGEKWELHWVFNLNAKTGVHVHQYDLPISQPVSHGCIRMSEADANWNYKWANGWIQEEGKTLRNGTPVIVVNNNPVDKASHWSVTENGIVSLVSLPEDFMTLPEGTESQQQAPWASGW